MTGFADQLFTDLMHEHGATLTAPGRPKPMTTRRPARIAAGLVGAAAAATTGIVLFTGGSPAYALTDNPNGSVTLAISEPSGIREANEAFARRGDRVVIVPVRAGCTDIETLAGPASPGTTTTSTAREAGPDITIDVQGIPEGRTALIGVDSSGDKTRMALVLSAGPAPACVSLPDAPAAGDEQHSDVNQGPSLTTRNG